MSATILDGKARAGELRAKVAATVAHLSGAFGVVPGLAVVLVGENPASEVYVASKSRQTLEAGMRSFSYRLPASATQAELLELIAGLNHDDAVDGILVQLPLPGQIETSRVIEAIDPAKDVDGFHPMNVGRLAAGMPGLVPCTPLGCLMLLTGFRRDLTGLEAVVIGRSAIVGKPMAQLLLAQSCTVTIAHSRTRDLPGICRRADILVAAVGQPAMVAADWVKPGAIVLDVGINRVDAAELGEGRTRIVGDVDTQAVAQVAGAITPVPGGVGPMTIACLLANTVTAACQRRGLEAPFVQF